MRSFFLTLHACIFVVFLLLSLFVCCVRVCVCVCVCIVFALPSLHFHKSFCSHNFIDGAEVVSTCPSGIQFLADDTIGPDGVGLFKCAVTNGIDLRWTVNGTRYLFQGDLTIGHIKENKNGLAVLLVKDIGIGNPLNLGNRTSMLYYKPDPGFIGIVTIKCGGTVFGDCSVNFSVTGELLRSNNDEVESLAVR